MDYRTFDSSLISPRRGLGLLRPAICLGMCLLASGVRADTDLIQAGQVTINPSTSPVILTLQGPAFDSAAAEDYGLVLGYHDSTSLDPTAGAFFRLSRPAGQYQWQLSKSDGEGRLAMQLGNDHALSLFDAAGTNSPIVITPGGTDPMITINGQRVATFAPGVTGYVPLGAGGLSVNGSGYVGIGTASPSQQLEITGNFRLPPTTANSGVIYSGSSTLLHGFDNGFFVGKDAGNLTSSGSWGNTGVGTNVLHSVNGATSNTSVGAFSMEANTTGSYNVAVGTAALYRNTTGYNLTAIGDHALSENTTGTLNVAVGVSSLRANTSGSGNLSIGGGAMYNNKTGYTNTSVGHASLFNNISGIRNIAVGDSALYNNTVGNDNAVFGVNSLWANTASNNVAIGNFSQESNVTGDGNSSLGIWTLNRNTTGRVNTAVGAQALNENTAGEANVAMGLQALYNNTTGGWNAVLGSLAGRTENATNANTTGSYNTFVGYASGPGSPTQLTNATAIGAKALVSASNAVVLGGTGDYAVKVGIGTASPGATLDVVGNAKFTGRVRIAPQGDLSMGEFTAEPAP